MTRKHDPNPFNSREQSEAARVTKVLDEPSEAYRTAIEAHNVALRAYRAVVEAFRSGMLSDADYLEARRLRDEANAAFDRAFDAEAGR